MVVGYSDPIDGCTDGSSYRENPDELKMAVKDDNAVVQKETSLIPNNVPAKIVDICSRTTADKDKDVETTVDVYSSSEESTAECESSSEDGDGVLDLAKNNQTNQMVNQMKECKDFMVATNVHITNNYPPQPLSLDVEQLKNLADGSIYKSLWADDANLDESIEKAQAKVSYPFVKALAMAVTTTLVLVIVVVGLLLWQMKLSDSEGSTDSGYDAGATIFGPTAPPNVTLITRQICGLKDPVSYRMDNLTVYPPPLVLISHTVSAECFNIKDCCEQVRNAQSYHMGMGWGDIGSQFYVGGDGRIYEGRQWHLYPAIIIGYNCMSYGVGFIGDFTVETPRLKQVLAAEKLLTELETNGYLPKNYTIYGEKQLIPTESPGAKVMDEVQKWKHWSSEVKQWKPCS